MAFKVSASADVTDLIARMGAMKKGARNRVLRRAVNAGSRIVLKVTKKLAPKESGLLRKSLGRKVKTYPSGVVVGLVGPRPSFRQPVTRSKGKWLPVTAVANPEKYTHLVELGTRPHALGDGSSLRKGRQSGTAHPGAAARPFLAPAARQATAEVRRVMAAEVAAGLAKLAAGGGAP